MRRTRIAGIATVFLVTLAGLLFLIALPAVEKQCGMPALDTRFGWTAEQARQFVTACNGIKAPGLLMALDALFPAAVAISLVLWTVHFAEVLRWTRTQHIIVIIPAIAGAVSDYLENTAIAAAFFAAPSDTFLQIGGVAGMVKNIGISIAVTILISVAGVVWYRRCASQSSH